MIRKFACAVVFLVLLPLQAVAQGLPEDIATPYQAYQEALAGGDLVEARTQARAAWDAAEALQFDAGTTSILADNYAQLALRTGEFAEAMTSFRRTAELLEADNSDAFTLAQTWMLAAHSALSAGEYREARQFADTAGDMAESAGELPEVQRADLLFNSRAIQAVSHRSDGNMRPAFGRANEAIEVAGAQDFTNSPYYGLVTFVLGATHSVFRDSEEAAYWLTIAYHYLPQEQDALFWWSQYARNQLDDDERLNLLGRLAEVTLPEIAETQEATEREEAAARREALLAQEGFVDATPSRRREPSYPRNAAAAGFEGIAVIQFTVAADGSAEDVEVLMSVPVRDFGEAGESAVSRWRYEPATQGGEAVDRPGMITEFRFVLAD